MNYHYNNNNGLLIEREEDNEDNQNTEVYVWGGDHCGQLGLGQKYVGKSYPSPRVCSFNLIIKSVSCGEEHSAFVTSRRHIYTMGSNNEGRLGIGNRNIRQSASPCLVEACSNYRCITISCGWGHTVAVMENGEAFSWGVGEYGALGQGTLETQWKPGKVILDDNGFVGIIKAACGSKHSAFISEFGNVYFCGSGDAGQLGTGRRDRELKPVQLTGLNDKINQIVCGIFHTLILTGNMLCIDCENEILLDKGKVYSTGGNTFGQLGIGNKKNVTIPTRIKELDRHNIVKIACGHHSAALTDKGEIYIWGTGIFGEYLSPTKFSQTGTIYKDIEIGGFFGAALDENCLIWTWGNNTSGELGLGDFEPRTTPFPNIYLQTKRVNLLSCGGSYVIALGKVSKIKKEKSSEIIYQDQKNERIDRSDGPRNSRTSSQGPKEQSKSKIDNPEIHKRETSKGLYDTEGNPERDPYDTMKYTRMARSDLEYRQNLREPMYEQNSNGYVRSNTDKYSNNKNAMNLTKTKHNQRSDDIMIPRKYDYNDENLELDKNYPLKPLNYNCKGNNSEEPHIDLLIKQKNALESSLRQEREEKRNLEASLQDLRKKVYDLQIELENSIQLKNKLDSQIQRFEELKKLYDEEVEKNEKTYIKLDEHIRQNNYLKGILNEKDYIIEGLQARTADFEIMIKQKENEIETLSKNYMKQKEREKQQLLSNEEEIAKLQRTIKELNRELDRNKQNVYNFELIREKEMESKQMLETEILELSKRMAELAERLDHNMNKLEKEQQIRFELQDDIVNYRNKNEKLITNEKQLQSENLKLSHEIEDLRITLEKNEENEKINRQTIIQENELLNVYLRQKEMENRELNDRIIALQQQVNESEAKNNKLVDLLNQEIIKQAEEYKQKTFNTLVDSAKKNAQNIKKIIQSPDRNPKNILINSPTSASKINDGSFVNHEDSRQNTRNSLMDHYTPEKKFEQSPTRHRKLLRGVNSGNLKMDDMNINQRSGSDYKNKYLNNHQPDFSCVSGSAYSQKSDLANLPKSPTLQNQFESIHNSQQQQQQYPFMGNKNPQNLADHGNDTNTKFEYLDKEPLDAIDEHKRRLVQSANKLINLLDIKHDKTFSPTKKTPTKKIKDTQKTPQRTPEQDNSSNNNTLKSPLDDSNLNNKEESILNKEYGDTIKAEDYLSNLDEVKERLIMLQKNKTQLEDKMLNFEKKLKTISK